MARRRSLNRRWSRKSINDSAVLDQDSNYIDEEDDTFWRHLPDQTRYSNRLSVNAPSEVFLNSNSRIIDDDDIEATEWWNNLQKTNQEILVSKTTTQAEVSNSDEANVSNATSHSSAHSITEAIKKKRVMLGAKRKRSGKNPFSQALDLSDITIESEPTLGLKKKDISQNLSRSVEEGAHQSNKSIISSKSKVRYSPDSNTSTDTETISKVKPVLFRRPKRTSSSAFSKILSEDISIVEPSQPLNANNNKTLDKGNELQERNEDTNKTKEFMTQPRSPFDKIQGSYKNSDSNIIIESQENEDHQNNFENSELSKTSLKPIDDSLNDENNERSKDTSEITNTSIRSSRQTSHQQSSDRDENLKLQLSDRKTSEDDVSLPTRSHRSSKISNPPSFEGETIETKKSNRLSKQRDDTSVDQNVSESNENIQEKNKSAMSNRELLSARRTQLSIVNPEDKMSQESFSNKSSSTDSLFEVPKRGYQSLRTQEQLNSDSLVSEDKSTDRENEEQIEFDNVDFNENSNNISEKSIQKPTTRISNNKDKRSLKRQLVEVSQHNDQDQMESNLEERESISHRRSLRSSRLKIIDYSLSDDGKESNVENRKLSVHKSSPSLKQRTVEKIISVHENTENSELEEDIQNDNVSENAKSLTITRSQLNLSIDRDKKNETEKSQKLTRNRKTKETSVSYRCEEQESDKENDVTEKVQKSLKNKETQPNSLTVENEDERELESTEGQTNVTEEIQESVKQQKLSSMQSISRKLFSENLENKSTTTTESEKSRENSKSIGNIDPSAYELPSRTRSESYSGSDTDGVHENSVAIENDQPMESMRDNNKNSFDPSITAQTPLPNTSVNQRSKLFKKPEASKTNTLDRYFLSSKSKLGHSEDIQLSQEQLQTLENKLKKIKEKTDKITRKEVTRVHETIAQLRNSPDLKSTARNNLGNLKNKNKTPKKQINKAYVVDGVYYKQPKLPRPQKWATNRLYKFLWKKMEPKYNLDTRRKSEKFINYLADVVKVIKRRKNFENYEEDLNELIKKMAQLGIIKTRMDFHNFCSDFLPYAFRVKVTPMLMPGNVTNIPFDPDILTVPVIDEQ